MAGPTPFDATATSNAGAVADSLAATWLARLDSAESAEPALLPRQMSAGEIGGALAGLASLIAARGSRLSIVVPDDELAPAISGALDPNLRPLCLMLPAADFAVRVVVRATISLLRNALARNSEDPADAAWAAQQHRIRLCPQAWQDCLAWADDPRGDKPWPPDLASLFPLRVVAMTQLKALDGDHSEFAVAVSPASIRGLSATRGLQLQIENRQAPVHLGHDADRVLRAELDVLSQELGHMELELATVQAEVGDFARRYYLRIGSLMAELDALEAKRALRAAEQTAGSRAQARAAAAEASSRAEKSRREQEQFADPAPAEPRPFRASSSLKRLYRQVAQKIHPDRAIDEADRMRRTALMSEANRAYRAADEASLREVLDRFQEVQDRVSPAAGAATIHLQLERVRRRLGDIQAELRQIFSSRLYELFVAARLARRQGRDLLEEMASDLAARIAAAKDRLQE